MKMGGRFNEPGIIKVYSDRNYAGDKYYWNSIT